MLVNFHSSPDYINGVLYELENGDTSKPSSKEDWDSAITFTARTSGENFAVVFSPADPGPSFRSR